MAVHDLTAGDSINTDAAVPPAFQERFDRAKLAIEWANGSPAENHPFGYTQIDALLNLPPGSTDRERIDAARSEWDEVLAKHHAQDYT